MVSLLLLAAALWAGLWWARVAWAGLRADRRLDALEDVVPEPPPGGWPGLSVIVAARDEASGAERAVRSLLGQDYPELTVVAIDDRSRDGTAEILDRLAAESARLALQEMSLVVSHFANSVGECAASAA